MPNNVYEVETKIIERAAAKIPAFNTIMNVSALNGEPKITPAGLFIRPMELTVIKDSQGRNPELRQSWALIVCVPHIIGETDTSTSLQAGSYVHAVVQYFAGWKIPLDGYGIFRLSASQPPPDFGNTGRAEFPVLFETQFSITSEVA